jgi:hypothetical protein
LCVVAGEQCPVHGGTGTGTQATHGTTHTLHTHAHTSNGPITITSRAVAVRGAGSSNGGSCMCGGTVCAAAHLCGRGHLRRHGQGDAHRRTEGTHIHIHTCFPLRLPDEFSHESSEKGRPPCLKSLSATHELEYQRLSRLNERECAVCPSVHSFLSSALKAGVLPACACIQVVPSKLTAAGFTFQCPTIESGIQAALK